MRRRTSIEKEGTTSIGASSTAHQMIHRSTRTQKRESPLIATSRDVEQSTSADGSRPATQSDAGSHLQVASSNHSSSSVSREPSAANTRRRRRKRSEVRASFPKSLPLVLPALSTACLLLLCIFFWSSRQQRLLANNNSKGWWVLTAMSALPILSCASVVLRSKHHSHQRLIAGFFVGAIVCGRLPKFISSGLVVTAIFVLGLATRPIIPTSSTTSSSSTGTAASSSSPATPTHPGLWAAIAAILTTLSLLVENFFIWVVSATYYPSHNGSPTPLQDNGRLVQQYMFQTALGLSGRTVQSWRATLNVQWALVAGFAAALVVCELQLVRRRNVAGLATRALSTLAAVRFIRTISFLITVLPSQVQNCYRQRFPMPPPTEWGEWVMVGLAPRTHGGCNDLIVSGHATVTTVLACVSTSMVGNLWFSFGLWVLLAIDFCVEVYEGFHYSVDMWMGALLTSLLWRVLAPMEEACHQDVSTKRGLHPLSSTTPGLALQYAIPAMGAYMAISVFPESAANYWIVLYVLVPGIQILRGGFTHLVQHELFLTLTIALGTYL